MASIVETVRTTIAENIHGGAALATKQESFGPDDVPDLSGKTMVITGGTEGIGYACTYTWLSRNAKKVVALSPSQEVYTKARAEIAKELGEDKASRFEWMQLDLSDWKATTTVAGKVADSVDRIDALVLNAARGIMTAQRDSHNIDLHLSLNHFGHVILTSHLMPVLKKSAENGTVRIAIQGSNAHQGAPSTTKFESIDEINKDEGPNGQYGRSKLANILYARYLSRHLQGTGILANASHPGFVETRQSTEHIHEPYPIMGYAMSVGFNPFKKDIFEGCASILYNSTANTSSGQYICPPAIPEAGSSMAQDDKLGDQLMKFTVETVQAKMPEARTAGCPFDLY